MTFENEDVRNMPNVCYGRSCITPQTPRLSNIPLQNNPLTFGRYLFACALVCHVSGKK